MIQLPRSILLNLVENARQHGSDKVAVEIGAAIVDESPARLKIVARDDGPGVSPANAECVFEQFFATARDQGGTGLGLAAVNALLEAHGGRIELLLGRSGASFALHQRLAATQITPSA